MQGSNVDCKNNKVLCIYEISKYLFYFPRVIIPEARTDLIKSEILNNLPYVIINEKDLYIHIRGGDAFYNHPHCIYAQPPLCFYEKIIKSKVFKKIYIISEDDSNIIIPNLLKKYKKIIHIRNKVEYDISFLCHAYNIVISISSFVLAALKLNENLKEIWEYDLIRLSEKFFFLHHHIYIFYIL